MSGDQNMQIKARVSKPYAMPHDILRVAESSVANLQTMKRALLGSHQLCC